MTEHRAGTLASRQALFETAVRILEERYREPLTLELVADALHVSARQLQRVFEQVGDTTFRAALTELRMESAARELLRTNRPAAEVGRHHAYSEPSQFTKAFRNHHGQTPSEYRAVRGAAARAQALAPARRRLREQAAVRQRAVAQARAELWRQLFEDWSSALEKRRLAAEGLDERIRTKSRQDGFDPPEYGQNQLPPDDDDFTF